MPRTLRRSTRTRSSTVRKRPPADPNLSATAVPALVKLRPARYLAISGTGAPEGDAFQSAVGALYAFAYTIKMSRQKAGRPSFPVSKLEGLWWVDDPADGWRTEPRSAWHWQVLIRVPSFVRDADLCAARAALVARKHAAADARVELVSLAEGESVQVMHTGPYATEAESIAKMDAFAREHGRRFAGKHHEIYLGDPRRTAPERLRTILRHPVQPA